MFPLKSRTSNVLLETSASLKARAPSCEIPHACKSRATTRKYHKIDFKNEEGKYVMECR